MTKLRLYGSVSSAPVRDGKWISLGRLAGWKGVCTAFVFCVATAIAAPAQTFTTLLNFDATNGSGPVAGLIQATDGNLYGTTYYGGSVGYGTIFKITPSGTLSTLHSFDGTDGSAPLGLIQATDGNFYGTTWGGTTKAKGSVFKITPDGTFTTLYTFCSVVKNGVCQDGSTPAGGLVQATNGDLYGTTQYGGTNGSNEGTVFKITTSGTLTTLHSFCAQDGCTDGGDPGAGLIQASNGDLYGTTLYGAAGYGMVFKITPSGTLTTLHSFDGTDGASPSGGLVQDTDGNFYGTTYYGGASGNCPSNCGTIFKMTAGGKLTTLLSFDYTDGLGPEDYWSLVQATDGNLYGTTLGGGNDVAESYGGTGTTFKITPSGTVTTLHDFCSVVQTGDCEDGQAPYAALVQHTNGKLYGMTYKGGTSNNGTVFSLSVGLGPFLKLTTKSGAVGSTIGILGQGFDSSSVVKFNGVAATKTTLTGTTYIVATVPAGATDGKVTVTTGATILTSSQTFIVHNSWSIGRAVPAAVYNPAAAGLEGQIYLVGGYTTAPTADLPIYNPATNAWSKGTSLPVATSNAAAAVVNNILYIFGGYTSIYTNAVWAYNPATKTWTGEAAMPTARNGARAVVENNIIYVIGGYNGIDFLSTVESYNPATNTWKTEASMSGVKGTPAAGLIASTIVVADGTNAPDSVTGDTEGYSVSTNKWTTLTSDPNPRTGPCDGVISGNLYDVAGYINNAGSATTKNESFSLSSDKWITTLAPVPQGTVFGGSAVLNGQLYCLGGESTINASPINNVQIYQP
jgi:uncharacterized repeat protein (TIGR03803 family)